MHGICLALLLDASGSVDAKEWRLQVEATAAALRSEEVMAKITQNGGAVITAIEFANAPDIMVPWTSILDRASAEAFANALDTYVRKQSGSTGAGDALFFANQYLNTAPPCERKVVDISTDGWANSGMEFVDAVAAAQLNSTMVNAIVINDETAVVEKYTDAVNGFTIEATWESYADAIKKKLTLEMVYWAPPLITPLERAYTTDWYRYGEPWARVIHIESHLITPPGEVGSVPLPASIGLLGLGWWLINRRINVLPPNP